MIVSINYADENFKKAQRINTNTAYKKGKINKVIEYSPEDIDKNFIDEHYNILKEKKGGGYWLWKPYIILKTMENMEEGDFLLYCDSGAIFINKIEYLIDSLEKIGQDLMPFELPLIERQWTQKETFRLMKCDEDCFKESNQVLATFILIRVNNFSRKFMKEYMSMCENEKILIDNKINECNDFIAHRHDQSIFSLLCKKYNLETFRDPSQYGIRPWEYLAEGRIYNPKVYSNSNYPQILVSQRKANIYTFRVKDFIKRQLTKLGILNENQFRRKNNIFL
ncbi:MAG: hypothetical protein E6342_05035 [Clostridium sp.]|uniref:hypothetical protein n=1 Tax=Clostridium TaxID=1485 RepID=UPI0029041C7F|nr:hypothetical protein [Clostridium sp.]MDU1277985.1 hypothetical protein [Clostridium sp.]MDU7087065.1 hypothetical protein [Clostridium sp.]